MLFLRSTLWQKHEGSATDVHLDVEISSRFIVEGKLRMRSGASAPGERVSMCRRLSCFFVDSLFPSSFGAFPPPGFDACR